jgi:hypothetical protein
VKSPTRFNPLLAAVQALLCERLLSDGHKKALEIVEQRLGIVELAKRLHTTDRLITAWRLGHAPMPEYKFLRLADVLGEVEPGWSGKP